MNNLEAFDPDSGAGRIVALFRTSKVEWIARHTIAHHLSISLHAVEQCMAPAIEAGLLTEGREIDAGKVWRRGPRFEAWAAAPEVTPAPAKRPASSSPAKAPAARRPHRPALRLADLAVAKNSPLPTRISSGTTRYDEIFDALTEADMCVQKIPDEYAGAVRKAALAYLKHRPQLAARADLLVRKDGAKTIGVWRVAKPSTGCAAA